MLCNLNISGPYFYQKNLGIEQKIFPQNLLPTKILTFNYISNTLDKKYI